MNKCALTFSSPAGPIRALVILVLTLALGLTAVGCGDKTQEEEKEGITLITINGNVITQEDLMRQYEILDQRSRAGYNSREGMLRLIDDMVSVELLYQEAQRQEVDENSQTQYEIERMKKDLMIRSLVNQSVNQGDIYRMFQLNYRRANVILARLNPDDPGSEAAAEKKIKALYQRIQKGEDFEALAKTESDAPNAASDAGDTGYIDREVAIQMDSIEFQMALFDLEKPGDISEPVKGRNGWFIIQLKESKGNLSQAPPQEVSAKMEAQKQNEIYLGYISDLKSRPQTKIERDTDNIRAFLDAVDKQLKAAQKELEEQASSEQKDQTQEPETEPKNEPEK